MRVLHPPHLRRFLLAVFVVASLSISTAPQASASSPISPDQALKLPFAPGAQWVVTAAGSYPDATPHLTLSGAPMAFDMDVVGESDPLVLTVGSGRARLRCAATMAVVELDVAGHGVFTYLHLDTASLSGFLSTEWTSVEQGVPLGRMFMPPADGYVEDWDCGPQYVAGAHLHLEVPRSPTVLDGVRFDAVGPQRGAVLTSTNTSRAHVQVEVQPVASVTTQPVVLPDEVLSPATVITADQVVRATATIEAMLTDGYTPAELAQSMLFGADGIESLMRQLLNTGLPTLN